MKEEALKPMRNPVRAWHGYHPDCRETKLDRNLQWLHDNTLGSAPLFWWFYFLVFFPAMVFVVTTFR